MLDDAFDLNGRATGWGLSLTSNVKRWTSDVLRLQFVYGRGIQNYFNDAPVDVAPKTNFADPRTPILGEPLPVLGLTAFVDHTWNSRWSSSAGYSLVDIDNSDGQTADAFRRGQYALVNLLHYPASNVMVGAEFQWARRDNFADEFNANDFRVQASFKFTFSHRIGATP